MRKLNKNKIIEILGLYNLDECKSELEESSKEIEIRSLLDYLLSPHSHWALATAIILVLIPIGLLSPPHSPPRTIAGLTLLFLTPGYTLLRAAYPRWDGRDLQVLGLSITLSLTVDPLVGLALVYSPWGLNYYSLTFSLYLISVMFLVLAIIRHFRSLI